MRISSSAGLLVLGVHIDRDAAAVVVMVTASPDLCSVTVIASAWPLRYSSTELSTISQTRWCSPFLSSPPMYIARPLADGFQSFEDLDGRLGGVTGSGAGGHTNNLSVRSETIR